MKGKIKVVSVFGPGSQIACGLAWYLENGDYRVPWIVVDSLLGWIYVAYKTAQLLWA